MYFRTQNAGSQLVRIMNTYQGSTVYWDVREELYPYASRSLLAGLEMMEEAGEATRNADTWAPTAISES